MGQIIPVIIEVEVFVRESEDHFFALTETEKFLVATAVEDKLNAFKNDNYRNDYTIIGTQVKNVIK